MNTTLAEKVAKAAPYVIIPSDSTVTDKEGFVRSCLEELGIMDDEVSLEILMSGDCREGDARAVFCDKHGLPVPRFRKVWGILRDGGSTEVAEITQESGLKELAQTLRPIGQYSDEELLERYSAECDSAIEGELQDRSKGGNCIVFDQSDTGFVVNPKISAKLLKEARRRSVPASYHGAGKVYRVYPVGEFPEQVYIQCPVTGDDLFDGYSDKLGVKWEVEYNALVFIHLIAKSGVSITPIVARDLQKEFQSGGLEALKVLFPKVAETYDDLDAIDELPSLKTRTTARKRKDPFGSGSQTRY